MNYPKTILASSVLFAIGTVCSAAAAQQAPDVLCNSNGQGCLPLDLHMECGAEYKSVLTQTEYGVYEGEFQVPQYMVTNQADCRVYYVYPEGAQHHQFKLTDPNYTGANPAPVPAEYPIVDVNTNGDHIFLKFNGKGSYRMTVDVVSAPNTLSVEKLPVVPGDVNGDGQCNILDALLIAQYSTGQTQLTPNALYFADMDCNYSVDINDALLTAQFGVGVQLAPVKTCWGLP